MEAARKEYDVAALGELLIDFTPYGTSEPVSYTHLDVYKRQELDEAARIDGATELQNFIYNIVPLAKPIFTSVLLIVFVNTWNEFLFSNTFLQSDTVRTVSLKFYTFVGKMGADYGYIYAAAIISILPIVLIFLIMQNSFVDGMTAGSVKG